jgi:ketosteroid isomerase-like protein
MKTIFLLLPSLMFLLSHFTSAQSSDEKEVTAAVESLRKAMIDGNESMLKDLTAEELSYGHSSGKVEDRASFVESLVSGKSDFKTIDLTEQTIKIAGSTAIVRHHLIAETSDGGKPGNPNLYVLLVWQKQKGKWKLIARQAVKVVL